MLTTANAAETNGLTCLPMHGAQDSKFLVTHPMTDQCCLTSIARRSALNDKMIFGCIKIRIVHKSGVPACDPVIERCQWHCGRISRPGQMACIASVRDIIEIRFNINAGTAHACIFIACVFQSLQKQSCFSLSVAMYLRS
jgi:hypothetical protein